MLKKLLSLSLLILLSACSRQAPVPTDHYYRLPELTGVNSDNRLLNAISVITFQADGLYKERALLYSENDIELKQYHYHHWVSAPHRLLQERLAERLRQSNIANIVLTTFDGHSELIIKGQIKAFEWMRGENAGQVHVKILLQANEYDENLPVLLKEYSKVLPQQSERVGETIKVFASAVDAIFDEFYQDLKEVTQS